jgi:hypothetical protein
MTAHQQWLAILQSYIREATSMGLTNNGMVPQKLHFSRAKKGWEVADRLFALRHTLNVTALKKALKASEDMSMDLMMNRAKLPFYKFRLRAALKERINYFECKSLGLKEALDIIENLKPEL